MSEVVNVHEAKTHLSQLLERVKAGEEIVLAKAGKPYARLIPYEQSERPLGLLRNYMSEEACERLSQSVLEPTDEDTVAAWEGKYSNDFG